MLSGATTCFLGSLLKNLSLSTSSRHHKGFVMVDHPDFCSERELRKAKATMPLQLLRDHAEDEDEENEGGSQQTSEARVEVPNTTVASFSPSMQKRSLSSIRAGITVAMVAVALGFQCCENILHIFIYNRSSLRSGECFSSYELYLHQYFVHSFRYRNHVFPTQKSQLYWLNPCFLCTQ